MALVLADRVRETTTVVGTGTATLLGAIASYQSFAAIGNANTTYYTIVNQSANEWEVGIGTYTASGTLLSRDTVLSSSNSGSLVNFSAGTKDVWGDYPAGKAVTTDTLAYPPAIGSTTPAAGTFTEVAVTTATGESAFNENDTITGWLYSGKTFSVAGQETAPTGLFIGSAGTKMYINGSTGDDVNEYTLGTAWDITTATFVTTFSTAAQDTAPNDIFFKPDGLSMFIMGNTTDTIYQYTLGTAWSVATASYASKSFSVTTQEATPTGVWFKPDGTAMYVVGTTADSVFQYALSTAWDVSTASYGGVFYSVVVQEGTANQVNLSADGTKMWVLGTTGDDIWEYNLATAWDVSTATPVNNFYIGFQATGPTGMFIDSSAANRVFVVDSTADAVFQYNTANNTVKLDTEKLYVDGGLTVNNNFVAGANAYIDGTLAVQSTFNVSGTSNLNALNSTGTVAIGTGTGTVAHSFGASGTASGSTKTLNIGTLGLSGSTTNINIGSAVSGSLGTTTISAPTVNIGQLATQFAVTNTASAVNYVQVTGSATLTGGPTISAQGSDFNIPLRFASKGTGGVELGNPSGWAGLTVTTTNNPNRIALNAPGTGLLPTFTTQGVDTNAGMAFISKGTGAIDLAAGSSGVNISNGGTVTAITRTASGSNYTSFPAIAISAPTTAGGVQATASVTGMTFSGSNPQTINNGGTGYTVGNVLTVASGAVGGPCTLTVTAVSAGVITAVNHTSFGTLTTLPTVPYSVTGGTGSGATFTSTWQVATQTITNAGSGYVEQPTVTFSGGGGSGAAAYATVGSSSTIKQLGGSLGFSGSSGEVFRIYDFGGQAGVGVRGHTLSGTAPVIFPTPSNSAQTNISMQVASLGTGVIQFSTGGSLSGSGLFNQIDQFRVSHTASAVNYVQVTGAATGGRPTISAQGSDTNVGMAYNTKGAQNHVFSTNAGNLQFVVANRASTVNWTQVIGATAGFGPAYTVEGSDTNIPVVVQPKGTGALQAQQTDSTATGGNARGANAVDWQTSRTSASQVASGQLSVVAGGRDNAVPGALSVISGGGFNGASGQYAVVSGGAANSTSQYGGAIVGGQANSASGWFNFIGGGFTNSATSGTAVTTQTTTTVTGGSTAVTLSGSNANIRVGQLITGTGINTPTYVAAISGTSLTLSQAASASGTPTLSFFTPHGVVVGGGNNQATGSYSFIGGGGDAGTAANRNVASGDWSVVAGGVKNTNAGLGSFMGSGGSNTSGSFFGGNNITSFATNSAIVSGTSNSAQGHYSFIGAGGNNTVNANYTAIVGGSYGTTRGIVGNAVFPACSFPIAAASGVSQASLLILGRQTTDANPTVLASDVNAAGTNNQVILPNNSAYFFRGEVVSGVTGGGNTKGWTIEGVIKRGANAASTTLVGTPTVTSSFADAGASTWVIAVTADTTNGGLAVTFTGQAGTTIRTVAQIRTTEMTF